MLGEDFHYQVPEEAVYMEDGVWGHLSGIPLSDDDKVIVRDGFVKLPYNAEADAQTAVKWVSMQEFAELAPPIGLKLQKTPLMQLMNDEMQEDTDSDTCDQDRSFPEKSGKRKAEHFPIRSLGIGEFMVKARHEAHLVAKCYYAKKKLVWEVLIGSLKSKIEIPWDQICGMRAAMQQNILAIELNNPPMFFHEDNPKPRRHTTWKLFSDFTQGQASSYRIHLIEFPPGKLKVYHEKLAQCDDRFRQLNQAPFPSLQSPFFHSISYQGRTDLSYTHDLRSPNTNPTRQLTLASPQQRGQFGHAMPTFLGTDDSISPVLNEELNNQAQALLLSSQQVPQFGHAIPSLGIHETSWASILNEELNNQAQAPLLSSQQVLQFGQAVPSLGIHEISSASVLNEELNNQAQALLLSSQQVPHFGHAIPSLGIHGTSWASGLNEELNNQAQALLLSSQQVPHFGHAIPSLGIHETSWASIPNEAINNQIIPQRLGINESISPASGIFYSPNHIPASLVSSQPVKNQTLVQDPELGFWNQSGCPFANLSAPSAGDVELYRPGLHHEALENLVKMALKESDLRANGECVSPFASLSMEVDPAFKTNPSTQPGCSDFGGLTFE